MPDIDTPSASDAAFLAGAALAAASTTADALSSPAALASGSSSAEIGDISYLLKVDGAEMPTSLETVSIQVDRTVNQVGKAIIDIVDGDPSKQTFALSEGAKLIPGKSIEILAGYDGEKATIFKGLIVKQSVRADPDEGNFLRLECRDQAIKLTVGRKNQVFLKKTDKDIMSAVITAVSGLTAKLAATTPTLEQVVQYYATDWDFLVARAEANGSVLMTDDATVTSAKPGDATKSGFIATFGKNIFSIEADMDAVDQLPSVESSSWDSKTQAVITDTAANSVDGPGNLSSSTLAKVVGLSKYQIQTTGAVAKDSLQDWGKAVVDRASLAKIRGSVTVQGTAEIELGSTIEIAGMGERFNGNHYVSGIQHELEEGDWMTILDFGLSPEAYSESIGAEAPPASGLLPGVCGLAQGTVAKIIEDPDNAFRILVKVPILASDTEGIWARMAHPYASNAAGYFFLPEIGDEVVLGFFNDDPNFPVILGSLYSNDKLKPFSELGPDKDNTNKAIVTRSGLRLVFDDVKKVFTIMTPGKNQMIFDDDAGSITLKDQNNNQMVMDSSGVSLTSPGDITIKADKNLTLTGTSQVGINSDTKIAATAPTINQDASTKFAVSAGMGDVSATGNLTLAGKLVLIN